MSRFSSQVSGKKGRGRQRPLVGIALGVAALVVLPAAIAFACVPSSSIGFDKQGYKYNAGETVTVTGRGFDRDAPVVMKLQAPSGEQSTVGTAGKKSDVQGSFTDSFALASDAANGDYVVSVTVGQSGARETFTVEPKPADEPAPNPFTPPPPATNDAPPQTAPTETPQSGGNKAANRAARKKAVRKCKSKFRNNRAKSSAAKRRMAKRRNACIKKARKRFP